MREENFHLGVKALIVNSADQVLVLKIAGKPFWDLPGGRLQRGELPLQTLKREVFEETGIGDISHITPLIMEVTEIRIPLTEGDVGLIFSLYRCQSDAPVQLSDEHTEFKWCSPQDAAELLKPKFPPQILKLINELLVKVVVGSSGLSS